MQKRLRALILLIIYILAVIAFARFIFVICNGNCTIPPDQTLITSLDEYADAHIGNIKEQLVHRIQTQPFNLVSTILFGCAIAHTFFAHYFTVLSKRLRDRNIRLNKQTVDSFGVEVLRFMGEVEVIFGIWVIPLFLAIAYAYDWRTAIHYLDDIHYNEPMFVVVIMALASTAPILKLADDCLKLVARVGGETVRAWWWVLLTLGPLSGSLITEPGAMTISALLLGKQFYQLGPRPGFAYATLGLLFTNVSVGGVMTNFAAPPVLMVSATWGWDTPFMLQHFGWKALLGIFIANFIYFFIYRNDFKELEEKRKARLEKEVKEAGREERIPYWISMVHVFFLAWTVVHNHHPVVFIGTFLLFLGFYQATLPYQRTLDLKPAILVGFFLAGLVVHGNLQGWWIEPLLGKASDEFLLVLSAVLTSFNDNAEITFLASLIPSFDDALKYAVVAGAVSGGGLTVIANAPNPSGQAILGKYFDQGISAVSLLAAALLPAIVMGLTFYVLRTI